VATGENVGRCRSTDRHHQPGTDDRGTPAKSFEGIVGVYDNADCHPDTFVETLGANRRLDGELVKLVDDRLDEIGDLIVRKGLATRPEDEIQLNEEHSSQDTAMEQTAIMRSAFRRKWPGSEGVL